MTSPIEPRTASLYHASWRSTVDPRTASAIVLAAIATYLVIPALVPRELAFIAAQAGLAVVPLVAVRVVHPARPLAALGLRGAPPRFFLAAIAIGATAWYLNARLVELLPLPAQQTRALAALVDRPSLVHALAMFALVPALCEEIVFRGVLARALGRPLQLVPAAAASAVVFSLYHHSLVQALPTLTLGFALAVIAIRADSVVPTILAHALNNTLAIALSRDELPRLDAWLGRNPTLALVGCAGITGAGLALAARARR